MVDRAQGANAPDLRVISDLLQVSLPAEQQGDAMAQEVIDTLVAQGLDPQTLEMVQQHLIAQPNAWTTSAINRLQRFFETTTVSQDAGQQLFWAQGTNRRRTTIPSTSLMQLIDGEFQPGRFAEVFRWILKHRFDDDLERMTRALPRLSHEALLGYRDGTSLPHSYGEVLELARVLRVNEKALGHAWLADRMQRSGYGVVINAAVSNNGPQFRFANLIHAAYLRQLDASEQPNSESGLWDHELLIEDIYLQKLDMSKIAAYVDVALRAGFDTHQIYNVTLAYIRTFDRINEAGEVENEYIDAFFDRFEEQFTAGYPRLAAISARLASLYWQGQGNLGMASSAEYHGALGMLWASWGGRDRENPDEFADPKNWERATLEQARDFFDRSAELLERYEEQREMTMEGDISRDLPIWRLFTGAVLDGHVERARSLVAASPEEAQEQMAWRSQGDRVTNWGRAVYFPPHLMWQYGIEEPPVVIVKGKGYYMPPAGQQADVYYDSVHRRFDRIPQVARRSGGGEGEGGSTPPATPANGTPTPAAPANEGGAQASAPRFAGFVDGLQTYLNGLDGDARIAVEEFRHSYPPFWERIEQGDRYDLITRALDTATLDDGESVSSLLFMGAMTSLCQREGYMLPSMEIDAEDSGYLLPEGGAYTFGGVTLPVSLPVTSRPAARPVP